jgi:hypothetical protein
VGSPVCSCQFSTGSWLVRMMERVPRRSSITPRRSLFFRSVKEARPKSLRTRSGCGSSAASYSRP